MSEFKVGDRVIYQNPRVKEHSWNGWRGTVVGPIPVYSVNVKLDGLTQSVVTTPTCLILETTTLTPERVTEVIQATVSDLDERDTALRRLGLPVTRKVRR